MRDSVGLMSLDVLMGTVLILISNAIGDMTAEMDQMNLIVVGLCVKQY